MTDEVDRPRAVTAPLGVSPPANARPATQMSASAVPSTLESPNDPAAPPAAAGEGAPVALVANANALALDEIKATNLGDLDVTTRDDGARDAALAAAGAVEPPRRVGPATLMSPAVIAPRPGESTPPLAPENAVIDVGAPAHAFVPQGSKAPPGFGPHGMMHHGAGPGGGSAPPGRSPSTTFLVLVVGGVVAAVALLAIAVIAVVFVMRRRAVAADGPRGSRSPSGEVAPGSRETPRLPPRMGGPRARVSVTSAGALDGEAVRVAVNTALPRVDLCFAATELDPPTHELATYELDVAPSGEVRRAEPTTPGPRSLKLDACVVQNLRSVRMPRSAKSSAVKLSFFAPIDPR